MLMNGCRISQQLREYNPRQFGICSSSSSSKGCRSCFNKGPLPRPSPPRRFPFCSSNSPSSKRFLGLKSLGTNASNSSCSSSFVADNNDDLAGASFTNNNVCAQDTSQAHVLSEYLSPAEDGGGPPSERLSPVAGGIVALGKFDALHIGHRELAIQAAKIGVPFLLSFVGMAEVLGWEPRAPVVAKCDRKRVLSSWAPLCGNVTPKEFELQFSQVRNLTPQKFVEKLSEELGVCGVVAGQNYRFGYKAAGNSSDLVRLCSEYGMTARIINSVMDKNQQSRSIGSTNSHEKGQVSSTRVRYALANGDMKYVTELLGRPHRLMLMVKDKENLFRDRRRLSAPRSRFLNLPPKEGIYENCCLIIGDENVVPCRVNIDMSDIHLELDELAPDLNYTAQNLGIDFG